MIVSKEQRTRALRYKRPALSSMGYEYIQRELEEIAEACDDVAYYAENNETNLGSYSGRGAVLQRHAVLVLRGRDDAR